MTVYTLFSYIGIAALLLTALRYFLSDYKNVGLSFLQHFVGTLFIFSGFVKAVDPIGTSIKMGEYFEAMKLELFDPIATPLSVLMLVAELSLGIALLVGYLPKVTTSLLLLLNVFFLLLTGYTYLSGFEPTNLFFGVSIFAFVLICAGAIIEQGTVRFWLLVSGFSVIVISLGLMKFSHLLLTAPFNITKMKVTDCGCFGDFMKLKPWQTFYKDVILTFMALVMAIRHKHIRPALSLLQRNVATYATLVFSLFFCLYNFLWAEPIIDFRPYAIGNDINKMRMVQVPEKRDMVFTYKNKSTGKERKLKMNELSTITDADTCMGREDIILDEGIPARISNLFIYDENKEDITDSILHNPHYTLMVVSPKVSESCECCFKEHLNPLAAACDRAGIKFFALTSEDAEAFRHKNQTAYPFYSADETPIKTMMRSNPGLMLLKNGVVVNKWHRKHLPTFEQLNQAYFSKP